MRLMIFRTSAPRLLAAVAITTLFAVALGHDIQAASSNPFDTLLGSWRGTGQIRLSDGRTERLKCNAYYTGGGSTLGMAILCQSESSNVAIRSKLSQSGGRVSGSWEERTFNASGSASGTLSPGRVSLQISGAVTGSMSVSYSGSRQSVSISTQGIALKSVTIDLARS